ncbi:hypothetical protein [Mucisphaera calidilacus]|uniref:PEP-CTERM protein-sorting domain-containing protein n=1 Tax=Mucisphaera calidilacus TaxID=2527982 RepID=A0A518BU49_9BACT|nr:hypothetical protein [Mucisphaera calidilacus]QDU70499.1 hypothetical protein Pan265_03270 [Mucisphaera calidilacus]
MNHTQLTITLLTALGIGTACASAADVGFDDASAAAYSDGWDNFDDGNTGGGPGMGGWVFGGNAVSGTTVDIASSAGLGGGVAAIDTDGKAFKIHDTSGGFVDVFRFFDPEGLDAGQVFTMEMAVNFRGGFKGMDLRGTDTSTIFNLNVGGDDYTVGQATTGSGSLGNAYSNDTRFTLEFVQTTLAGGEWTVTRSGGIDDVDTGTYTGRAGSIKLYSGSQGSFGEDAIYYNNFSVTPIPAPGAAACGLLGLGGLALRRNR